MNIYEAGQILRAKEIKLDGRADLTEAIIRWDPENPTMVSLGDIPEVLNYATQVRPILDKVRVAPTARLNIPGRYFYEDKYFRFGGHVFVIEELEALDTWINYYAGPSVFST